LSEILETVHRNAGLPAHSAELAPASVAPA
jgi:hypothetical protein